MVSLSTILSNVICQWIVIRHGLKYLSWPGTFFLIGRGSRDHDVLVNFFFSRYKRFGIIGKII